MRRSPPSGARPLASPTVSCACPSVSKTSTTCGTISPRRSTTRNRRVLDFLLHADQKLLDLVAAYGTWVYGILFAIVFAETGFVVTPFLPGDSLLFAAGALCAKGAHSTPLAAVLLVAAAFTGNAVNYTIGRVVGPRVF